MGVAFPIPEIAQNWGRAIGSTGRACECVRVRAIRPAASLAFFLYSLFAVESFNAAVPTAPETIDGLVLINQS